MDRTAPSNTGADVDNGKMDGFVGQAGRGDVLTRLTRTALPTGPRRDGLPRPRVRSPITGLTPNFVLQDHMFEPGRLVEAARPPVHGLGMVGKLQATRDPMSCLNALQTRPLTRTDLGNGQYQPSRSEPGIYAWTDLTYLLYENQVGWAYYVDHGTNRIRATIADDLHPRGAERTPPKSGTPCPGSTTVKADHQLGNIRDVDSSTGGQERHYPR